MQRSIPIALGGVGILLTCALLVRIARLASVHEPKFTQASFDSIKPGCTLDEIEGRLGQSGVRVTQRCVVWIPKDGTLVSAFIAGNEDLLCFPDADPAAGHQLVWLDESGLIAGYFGTDDRLQDKYYSTVFVPEGPSFIDWIKSRW